MKRWIHSKATLIFVLTLIIYVLIWCTVSYVGVYVTYVAGPILLTSGFLSWVTRSTTNDVLNEPER
jgi:hypothetical protein